MTFTASLLVEEAPFPVTRFLTVDSISICMCYREVNLKILNLGQL